MKFEELVEFTRIALKLDKIRKKHGVTKDSEMYYELKETADILHDAVAEKLKEKRS